MACCIIKIAAKLAPSRTAVDLKNFKLKCSNPESYHRLTMIHSVGSIIGHRNVAAFGEVHCEEVVGY